MALKAASSRGVAVKTCRQAVAPCAKPMHRGRSAVVTLAMRREWPDKEFVEQVKAAFPDQGMANVEEARVLFSELGYNYIDVRPAYEYDEAGKVKGSVNIPIKNTNKVFSAAENKKILVKEENPNFLKMVQKKFPKTDTPLLIGCSDGNTYSIDALELLEEEGGYTNLACLKGGYYSWFRVFDNKLVRRRNGEYAENYSAGGDSCGIHSSGAGFDRSDKADKWANPTKY